MSNKKARAERRAAARAARREPPAKTKQPPVIELPPTHIKIKNEGEK